MTPEMVLDIGQQALTTTLLVSAPMLVLSLVVGLAVSIFQAVTQINEMTLTFIPKILAVAAALLFFFPWMTETIVSYTAQVFQNLPAMIR
ncbi:MAG: flagellar biosynthesis protein FliQ [Nitrospirae bacterium]|nr:flagellar biosynthesis protein FliQ [Nitrospirota bacterium]